MTDSQSPANRTFEFGAFVLDEGRGELLRDGRPLAIRPRPLRLLLYLLCHPDRVIPKEELLDAVWPGVAVGDASLATALKELRQALGDARGPGAMIQTVRGRGVRFQGPVERLVRTRRTLARPLVGRAVERQKLERALAAALDGAGSIALLVGEPGIGKSALGWRVLERARADGCLVASGTCDEEATPTYGPWGSVLESLRSAAPEGRLAELTEDAPELERLVGGAGEGRPELPGGYAWERLHRQVARFLQRVAEPEGLVVFLDDLQWCDADSLAMLETVAAAVATSRILLLLAARDAEAPPIVTQALARLSRLPGQRLVLEGLSEPDVGRLASVLQGEEIDAQARRRLTRRSGGNPFFVTELMRSAEWSDAPAPEEEVPVRVRDVVEARLARLPRTGRVLLEAAAVAGPTAAPGVVERACGLDPAAFVEALEQTEQAGLLSESSESGGLAFSHDLVRDAVLASLPRLVRSRLHQAVLEALEALREGGAPVDAGELARHAEAAVLLVRPERAVRYLRLAAGGAARQLAFESAADGFARALRLLDQHAGERRVRVEILLGLGLAHGARGRHGEAVDALRRAAEQARALGDAGLLAAAGLAHPVGGGLAASHTGTVDETLVEILEEAAERLSDPTSPLRVRVLARLATELYFTSDRERGLRLAVQALDLARRLDDPGAVGDALVAQHYCLWTPEHLEARLALSAEIVELGRRTRNPVLTFQGLLSRVSDELERGDLDAVRRGLEEQRRCAEELGLPLYRWAAANTWPTLAIAEGRVADAERLAQEALAAAQGHENPDVVNGYSGQMFMILRERDQLGTLLPIVEDHVARFPDMSVWRCALAFVHGELRDEERARREFEILTQGSFAALQEDMFRLFNLVMLAEACSFLGDARRAAGLARMLRPYAERNVCVGGLVMAGAGATYLGKLRATEERFDEATRYFERGLALNQSMGARLWEARTALDYARMLLRRRDGDPARAGSLIAAARRTADELELVAVARTARELADELPSSLAAG